MSVAVVSDTRPDQLPAIAAIYAAAVADGPATFDLDAPPLAWWNSVLDAVDPTAGHLMVSAVDAEGRVVGYAKSGSFRPKAAYDSTCEISIYIAAEARGQGVGDALYRELLARLDRSGLRLGVAGMTAPNPASARLHLRHGFTEVGTFAGVGVKFGQPWDVVWYQRPLRSAALLDRLAAAVERGANRAAAILREWDDHRRVALYAARDGDLELLGEDPVADQPPPDFDAAALAAGRGVIDGSRVIAPVIEPERGRPLGALLVEGGSAAFDELDLGRFGRCARALRPLWLGSASTTSRNAD